jgi:hypothetical protein
LLLECCGVPFEADVELRVWAEMMRHDAVLAELLAWTNNPVKSEEIRANGHHFS